MKKRIPTLAVFLVVMVAMLYAADRLFSRILPRDMAKKSNWMMQMEGKDYDFAVLGSSRAYHSVDITTVQQVAGNRKTGVNLGVDGEPFDGVYMILRSFLERNTVRQILLEVDVEGFDDSRYQPVRICNYLVYLDRPAVLDLAKTRFGSRAYIWRYVPFFLYAEFNDHIGPVSFVRAMVPSLQNQSREYDSTGTSLINMPFQQQVVENYVASEARIDPIREEHLTKIIELAKAKNIPVTLFMAPYYSEVYKMQLNRDAIIGHYRSIAEKHNLPFVVYDDPRICDNKDNFLDYGHLNKKGALEFSRQLGGIFDQKATAAAR